MAHDRVISASIYSRSASGAAAMIRMAWCFNHKRTESGSACATGIEKTVPKLARTTFGFNTSVPALQTTTPSTPAASADLNMVPRFPGFSVAVLTRKRPFAGTVISPNDHAGLGATANNPSEPSRTDIFANTAELTVSTVASTSAATCRTRSFVSERLKNCSHVNNAWIRTDASTAR